MPHMSVTYKLLMQYSYISFNFTQELSFFLDTQVALSIGIAVVGIICGLLGTYSSLVNIADSY